jgi:FkbM family methyltransferase
MIWAIYKKIKQFIRRKLVSILRDEFADKKILEQQVNTININITALSSMLRLPISMLRLPDSMLRLPVENELKLHFSGQFHQDLIAYLYLCGNRTTHSGFFIDIGAYDGITISNTYVFEQLGWNGICVEPLPNIFNTLRKNRKCDCYNVAIAEHSQNNQIYINATGSNNDAEGLSTLSGLESTMTEKHRQEIKERGGNIEYITVQTMTFNELMSNYPKITNIDFLSIDVEGGELNVLKSIDFDKFSFRLLVVENNEEIPGNGELLKDFMNKNGYKVLLYLEYDIIFIPI